MGRVLTMTENGRKTLVLNARLGWRASEDGPRAPLSTREGPALVDDTGGGDLRLPPARWDSPVGLSSKDGSLGGLLLPRGIAVDHRGRVILTVHTDTGWDVRRYDPERNAFLNFSSFDLNIEEEALSVAVVETVLYVPDAAAGQVLRIGLESGRHLAPLTLDGRGWTPFDVHASRGVLYVLSASGDIFHWIPERRLPPEVIACNATDRRWSRLAIDRNGACHVLYDEAGGDDGVAPALGRIAPRGTAAGAWSPTTLTPRVVTGFAPEDIVRNGNAIRDLFPTPPIRLWMREGTDAEDGLFYMPDELRRRCDRRPDIAGAPPPEDPLRDYRTGQTGTVPDGGTEEHLLFRRDGSIAPPPPPTQQMNDCYRHEAIWYSGPLDSRLNACQWDAITLELRQLPPGASVEVGTFTSDEEVPPAVLGMPMGEDEEDDQEAVRIRAGLLWATNLTILPGDIGLEPAGEDGLQRITFLVQSRPGRYLHLRLILRGDRATTPAVTQAQVRFPRQGYLDFLPAIFSADDEARWFLERFLAIFQTSWDDLSKHYGDPAPLFDPRSVSNPVLVRFLARRLGQSLRCAVDDPGRKRLLEQASRQNGKRATVDGFKQLLSSALANLTEAESNLLPGFPCVVEGFRTRRLVQLSTSETGGLDGGGTIWGARTLGRLKIGKYSKVGEARILPPGRAPDDYLRLYANSFRVFVPACWLDTDEKKRLFNDTIEAEKPAHTVHELRLVKAGLRVDLQSTIGVDTIVGALPVAQAESEEAKVPLYPNPNFELAPIISISPPAPGAEGQPVLR